MKIYSSNLINCLVKDLLNSVDKKHYLVDWQIIIEDKTYLKVIYRANKKDHELLKELS